MSINFLLKRSTTASKRPTAAQLDIGELSLNYDASTAGVFFEDSAGAVRKIGPAEVSATAPNASPAGSSGNSSGELWYDTSVGNLKIFDGTSFVDAIAAGAAAGSNTQVQFNSAGSLAGSANFTFDGTTASITGLSVLGTSRFGLAATQDAIELLGRNGGTSNFRVALRPATLSANRTQNLQNLGGVVALDVNKLNFFAATTSAELAGVISDETGSGALVFGTSPTLTTSVTLTDQAEARFAEAIANGSNYIALRSPSAVTSNLTFTLPGTDATSSTGYTLKSNGSAALSFGTANIVTADSAPSSPTDGDLWYDSASGRLFVYYDDGNTQQWVDTSPLSPTSTIRQLDNISSQFNGTTTAFTLQIGGANYTPQSTIQLLIAVGGVVQTPTLAYTVSGSTITFTSAPPAGATFSGIVLAEAVLSVAGSNTHVQYNDNGLMAGTSFLTIGGSSVGVGASMLPAVDNTYDLGSSTFRFANVFTGDLHLKNDRGDYTIVEEEDALTLRNNKTGKVYNFVLEERKA